MKLNKTRFKCKQNVLIIAHNINNINNIHELMKELNETNWKFIKPENINISLDVILHILVTFMIKNILKNISLTIFFAIKDIPWFTKSLKKGKNLYIKFINNRNDNDLRIYNNCLIFKYKNYLTNIIRKCKKDLLLNLWITVNLLKLRDQF